MTAIPATTVGARTMADGTLRLSIDYEPRHAQAAFALFGSPGTEVATAALKPGGHETKPEAKVQKGGELAKWCAMRCGEYVFRNWIERQFPDTWAAAMDDLPKSISVQPAMCAAQVIRDVCGVASRAEFDTDKQAKARFDAFIRLPFEINSRYNGAGE